MKKVGKEEGGLYLLIKHLTTQCTGQEKEVETTFAAHDVKEADMVLWHKRLGHISSTVLSRMFSVNKRSSCSIF